MTIVAVSLKMYFDPDRTADYCQRIREGLDGLDAVAHGHTQVVVFPSFLSIPLASRLLAGSHVAIGAQDLCQDDRGAFTGEVSGADLRAMGCSVVEVGHAERRGLYRESDQLIAEKVQAARRNQLIPLICVGEPSRVSAAEAAEHCIDQVLDAIGGQTAAETWIAYEPIWAIGALAPAPVEYVAEVCTRLRQRLAPLIPRLSILYGGGAGPGLLNQLRPSVDGLFLGRFAHDPAALLQIVEEAAA